MKKLETSKQYSLYQLFVSELEANGKIVVPDLQRDYCWGNDTELVPSFLKSLTTEFTTRPNHDVIMGLIYGYYENTRPNMLLCDGQQRITTLFLLIGLLYRYTVLPELEDMLMSKFERENDDFEPRLVYDIRESTKYYLSELVTNVFYRKGNIEDDVQNANWLHEGWWKKAYKLDPSIMSMEKALNHIFMELLKVDDLNAFAQFVANKLKFIFYDMGNRKTGEETFVLINTSGEPLTPSENLKPVLLSKYVNQSQKQGEIWERIDNWFWRNRDKKNEDTSNAGLNEFIRRVSAMFGTESEEYYSIFDENGELFIKSIENPLGKMAMLYDVMKALYEDKNFKEQCQLFGSPLSKKLDLKEYFIVLPTMAFVLKFRETLATDNMRAIIRVYRYFENLARYRDISRENDNIRLALDAVSKMPSEDICSLLDIADNISTTYILTNEEKMKLVILTRLTENDRRRTEDAIWSLQGTNHSNAVWNGEISQIISWVTHDGKFSIADFIKFEKVLDYLFKIDRDVLRRLLLTLGLENYPVGNGSASRCFVNSDAAFRPVIDRNKDKFQTLLNELALCDDEEKIGKYIACCIDKYPRESDWAEFVHCPYLLEYMNCKNIWHDEQRGWLLLKNAYARPFGTMNAHLLYSLGGSFTTYNGLCNGFYITYYANARDVDCVVVKNNDLHIEIDIYLYVVEYKIIIRHTDEILSKEILEDLGFTDVESNLEKSTPAPKDGYNFAEIAQFITELTKMHLVAHSNLNNESV